MLTPEVDSEGDMLSTVARPTTECQSAGPGATRGSPNGAPTGYAYVTKCQELPRHVIEGSFPDG